MKNDVAEFGIGGEFLLDDAADGGAGFDGVAFAFLVDLERDGGLAVDAGDHVAQGEGGVDVGDVAEGEAGADGQGGDVRGALEGRDRAERVLLAAFFERARAHGEVLGAEALDEAVEVDAVRARLVAVDLDADGPSTSPRTPVSRPRMRSISRELALEAGQVLFSSVRSRPP